MKMVLKKSMKKELREKYRIHTILLREKEIMIIQQRGRYLWKWKLHVLENY